MLVLFNTEEEFVDSGEESDVEADEHSQYPDEVPYPSARLERSSQELADLPSTVEVLSTHDGCRVYLVGTAHFSESSQQDVTKVCFCWSCNLCNSVNIRDSAVLISWFVHLLEHAAHILLAEACDSLHFILYNASWTAGIVKLQWLFCQSEFL